MKNNQPICLETFYAKIAASEKAMDEGKFTSHEDLKKQGKTWGKENPNKFDKNESDRNYRQN